jgi:hypothetical protein
VTFPEFVFALFAALTRFVVTSLGATFDWLREWLLSPGFGGAAAVVAAAIAYVAARRQAEANRAASRKEQWWKRAEWALNLTLSDKSENRIVGLDTLDALSRSEWVAEHEGDVIAAATEWALGEPEPEPGDGQAAPPEGRLTVEGSD